MDFALGTDGLRLTLKCRWTLPWVQMDFCLLAGKQLHPLAALSAGGYLWVCLGLWFDLDRHAELTKQNWHLPGRVLRNGWFCHFPALQNTFQWVDTWMDTGGLAGGQWYFFMFQVWSWCTDLHAWHAKLGLDTQTFKTCVSPIFI